MITGRVTRSREPQISLLLVSDAGKTVRAKAVIDTGFTGALTLPVRTLKRLEANRLGKGRATLADGSSIRFDVYAVAIIWDGEVRVVAVDSAEVTPLVGMRLLDGFRLQVDGRIGGRVAIESTHPDRV